MVTAQETIRIPTPGSHGEDIEAQRRQQLEALRQIRQILARHEPAGSGQLPHPAGPCLSWARGVLPAEPASHEG